MHNLHHGESRERTATEESLDIFGK